MPLGLAWTGVVWAELCVAAPWGFVVGVSCPTRRAFRIGLYRGSGGRVTALCRCDWRGERGVGGAVLLGLLGRALCGWRCAAVIGGERVLWVAVCCRNVA